MAIQRVLPKDAPAVRADERHVALAVQHATLRRGDSGPAVKALQRELHAAGLYNAPIDGSFGPITEAGVKTLQQKHGLTPNGVVGPQTAQAIKENDRFVQPGFQDPAVRGQAGKDILGVEKKLHALGYDTGKVDGVFRNKTVKAVRAFRKDNAALPDDNATIDRAFARELQKAKPKAVPGSDTLKKFSTTPPKNDYTHVQYGGVTINARTKEMLQRADFIMQHELGHKGFHFTLSQGSYNHSVGASAGTHDGGGAIDVHDSGFARGTVDDMVKALRTAGFAAWSRGRGHDSFPPHIHALALGDRQMSSAARAQIPDYAHGRNGLVGHAQDPDSALGRPVPDWAKRFL